MPRTRTQRRFATWLAMLALGLLLFAPTVSRTVQALEHSPDGAWCSEYTMGNAHHPSESGHAGSHVLDACAYCSLLSDNPALPWALAVLPALVPSALDTTPCTPPLPPYQWPLNLCPRGPPQV
ncbi:DUF2946 family protein [Pseudomonas fluorescens group sp. PF-69]